MLSPSLIWSLFTEIYIYIGLAALLVSSAQYIKCWAQILIYFNVRRETVSQYAVTYSRVAVPTTCDYI